MTILRWNETDRQTLGAVLPEALVVQPVGATEQHGPHLPTGTDALIVGSVAEAAVDRAGGRSPRTLVLAPTLPFGASDHHFAYGATLSFTPETMTAALVDLARSVAACGGRRMVLVNGHGGNRGACHAAAAAASTRHALPVAYLDYWDLLPAADAAAANAPGHAGRFETSVVSSLRPDLVRDLPERDGQPAVPKAPSVSVYAQAVWLGIDGYTDSPGDADAAAGKRWFDTLADAFADRLVTLAEVL